MTSYAQGSFTTTVGAGYTEANKEVQYIENNAQFKSMEKQDNTDIKSIHSVWTQEKEKQDQANSDFIWGIVGFVAAVGVVVFTAGAATPFVVAAWIGVGFATSDLAGGVGEKFAGNDGGWNLARDGFEFGSEKLTGTKEWGDVAYTSVELGTGIFAGGGFKDMASLASHTNTVFGTVDAFSDSKSAGTVVKSVFSSSAVSEDARNVTQIIGIPKAGFTNPQNVKAVFESGNTVLGGVTNIKGANDIGDNVNKAINGSEESEATALKTYVGSGDKIQSIISVANQSAYAAQ
ncbi:MAG: hypothetical protein LBI11_02730 [Streptococcaceae bacterium]|jgi:hypothetical protein|nr:hypothetical protein [Streptococcaceae bacterium]